VSVLPIRTGRVQTKRYALFTLVGITGEDDLDAPDLPAAGLSPEDQSAPPTPQRRPGALHQPTTEAAPGKPLQRSDKRAHTERPKPPTLSPEASESLRHKLISELEQFVDPEALCSWAHRALPLKNQLSTADVEAAFAARLSQFRESAPTSTPENRKENEPSRQQPRSKPGSRDVTVIGKPVRERDREHLKFVAAQPCLVCGRTPSDPHHIKFAEQRAIGRDRSIVSNRRTTKIVRDSRCAENFFIFGFAPFPP
jgi:hypothetical protein